MSRARRRVAGLLLARGASERTAGRYRRAGPLLRAALWTARRTYGGGSAALLPFLNELALLGKQTGDFDRAEVSYRRALALCESAGCDDATLAALHHNLGGLEHARGRYAAAERWARRSVELRTRSLGSQHPATAADLAALAAIVDAQGRHTEAEPLFRDSIRAFERAFGADHHEVAVNLGNLAACLQARGELEEAEPLYRRALAIKEQVLGERHPELVPTLNNLAVLLRRRGDHREARALYERCLAILDGQVAPSHPTLRTLRANLRRVDREPDLS